MCTYVNLWAKNYFSFCVLPLKTWQPIWSYLAICKIKECFCEYLALQLAQTNGFFPSWTASIWFNKLRFDEKQLTHWSHLNGVSCKYHGRFMVSRNTRKSIPKVFLYLLETEMKFQFRYLYCLQKLFQFFSCFQLFGGIYVLKNL